jgi:hypothetical protein
MEKHYWRTRSQDLAGKFRVAAPDTDHWET